jgi:hypothetical protein
MPPVKLEASFCQVDSDYSRYFHESSAFSGQFKQLSFWHIAMPPGGASTRSLMYSKIAISAD